MSNFDLLKEEFPIFQIKNRTNVSKLVELNNGETVQVQPQSVSKIDSSLLNQIPNFSIFKPISPSIEDYQRFNCLKTIPEKVEKSVPKNNGETDKNSGTKNTGNSNSTTNNDTNNSKKS